MSPVLAPIGHRDGVKECLLVESRPSCLLKTQNVTATFAFVRKLSQAKNFQEIVKIQTEFMSAQLNSFNDQAKIIGEIYTKAATAVAKTPSTIDGVGS